MTLSLLLIAASLRVAGALHASHAAVVADPTSAAACGERLRTLRRLVAAGDHDAAVDLSFALEGLRAARSDLHADCRADAPFSGAADVVVSVRTPRRRAANGAARPTRTVEAVLRRSDGTVSKHAYAGPAVARSLRHPAAEGSVLDGAFVHRAVPRRPASRVDDKFTAHAIGQKTLLVSVLCPATTDGTTANDCSSAYDIGLIAQVHGGDVFAYLDEILGIANAYWDVASWGNFSVVPTYTPILEVDYAQNACEDADELDWYGGGYDGDAGAFDVLAAVASLDAGFDREAYDMNVVFIPECAKSPLAGSGYTGSFGAFINLDATDYDPSLIHELGHNFGANHASYVSNDVTNVGGTTARYDDDDLWIEYGNLFTPMGAGSVYEDAHTAHFTVEGKAVFDWLPKHGLRRIEPYDDAGNALCSPCTFTVYATDTGKLELGSPVGLQIATSTEDFFLFVEYRSNSPYGTRGALLTWSGFAYNAAQTGTFGNTLMVDSTPETGDLRDALFQDHTGVLVDVGTADEPRPLSLYFKVVADDYHLDVELYSSATLKPTISMAPTTAAPTLPPTTEDEKCGKDKYCCAHVDYGSYARFYKIRDATQMSGEEFCCSERCSFVNEDGYYLHYISQGGQYYITESEPCYDSGSLSFTDTVTDDEVKEFCEAIFPTSEPTASLAPSAGHFCVEDDATWYQKKKPANDCSYIAKKLDRCSKTGADGRTASEGCDATCYECEPRTPKPTSFPTACVDSETWATADGESCTWVGLRPFTRCADGVVGADGTAARDECPYSCYKCRASECLDSASWYSAGKPSKNCAWVSSDPNLRCLNTDDAGEIAYVSCADSCDTCEQASSCSDDSYWRITVGAASENCAWVGESDAERCAMVGDDGRDGNEACEESCSQCFATWNTAAPSSAPSPAPSRSPTARPSAVPTELCEDSTSWADAEKGRNCGQIGKKPFERCGNADSSGVVAMYGCPKACLQCGDVSCDDDVAWYGKKPAHDCGYVAEKVETRCTMFDDVSGTYAYMSCPATCDTCELAAGCADSTSWYAGKKTQDSCEWVRDDPNDRCGKSSDDGVKGEIACPTTCGSCPFPWTTAAPSTAERPPEPTVPVTAAPSPGTCEDSSSFQIGSLEDCAYIANDPVAYCGDVDESGVEASDACPSACWRCGHDDEFCEDSTSWYQKKKPSRNCAYVGELAETRCLTSNADGLAAYLACPEVCGTCAMAEDCADSKSWLRAPTREGKEDEDCAWVADKPETRCEKVSDVDGVAASVACPAFCGTCGAIWFTGAPTPDRDCYNDPDWYWGDDESFDCKYVSERPDTRCGLMGKDGTLSSMTCPLACGNCGFVFTDPPTALDCVDSTTWHIDGKPDKDCKYLESSREIRCPKVDEDGITGWSACQTSCGTCDESKAPTVAPTRDCVDSTSWYSGVTTKDCDWVEKKGDKCTKYDESGSLAEFACPVACGLCTARPSTQPSSAKPSSDCYDSATWFQKKSPSKNCPYVAKKADRCKKKDDYGVLADEACPFACKSGCALAAAPTPAVCEDAANGDWYYKKDKNDCGWIGDNLNKCDQMNQDGEYANDFCPETCGTC